MEGSIQFIKCDERRWINGDREKGNHNQQNCETKLLIFSNLKLTEREKKPSCDESEGTHADLYLLRSILLRLSTQCKFFVAGTPSTKWKFTNTSINGSNWTCSSRYFALKLFALVEAAHERAASGRRVTRAARMASMPGCTGAIWKCRNFKGIEWLINSSTILFAVNIFSFNIPLTANTDSLLVVSRLKRFPFSAPVFSRRSSSFVWCHRQPTLKHYTWHVWSHERSKPPSDDEIQMMSAFSVWRALDVKHYWSAVGSNWLTLARTPMRTDTSPAPSISFFSPIDLSREWFICEIFQKKFASEIIFISPAGERDSNDTVDSFCLSIYPLLMRRH